MVEASSWVTFGASARGASHVLRHAPNQDAYACRAGDALAGRVIAAVADGHGDPLHFRSGEGARFAVEVAVELLQNVGFDSEAALLPERIVEAWTKRVSAHLAAHPFTDADWQVLRDAHRGAAVEEVRGAPSIAYGSTLLASAATGESVVMLQIGDGDLLSVLPDGRTTRPLPGDARLHHNMTTSLCGSGAARDFRMGRIAAPETLPALLVLSTDGYANSFNTDEDFMRVGADLLGLLRSEGPARVEKKLAGFLTDASKHGSGDDVTLALLYRDRDRDRAAP